MKFIAPILLVWLILPTKPATAQTAKNEKQIQSDIKNWWWVQVSPLSLFEPEVPISATIQFQPNASWGFAVDGGVFVARNSYDDGGLFTYSGVRFKPQVKYYFDIRKRKKVGFYLSMQGLFKKTTRNREEWFSRGSTTGQTLFNQLINYQEKKTVLGGSFLTGFEFMLGPQRKWMIEIYLGLGVRNKSFKAENLPPDIIINYDDGNDRSAFVDLYQNGVFPTLNAGFKIGYRIK